jgi:chromosome segregation ATPase
MLSKLRLLLIVIAFPAIINAQSFDQIEWQGKKVPAMTTEIYQNANTTEAAIKEYFEKLGFFAKVQKGILSYKNIKLSDIDDDPYDVLIKIDRRSKQEKDASIVYFSMAKNYDQYIKNSSDDKLKKRVETFISEFKALANEKALNIEIKNQEEKSKSAEKKLKDFLEEKENMEQKIIKLTQQKEDKIKEIQKQEQEVENQKKALENLLEKKKSS